MSALGCYQDLVMTLAIALFYERDSPFESQTCPQYLTLSGCDIKGDSNFFKIQAAHAQRSSFIEKM